MKIKTIVIPLMALMVGACKQPAVKTVPAKVPVKDTAKTPPKVKKVAVDSNKVGPPPCPPWCS